MLWMVLVFQDDHIKCISTQLYKGEFSSKTVNIPPQNVVKKSAEWL